MPVYEYYCSKCKEHVDKFMRMCDSGVKIIQCECGGFAYRVPSKSSFELSGGGWAGSGYSKGE